jgi:PncC family amidohydrolase
VSVPILALSQSLGARLRERGLTVATAESCTGGALAAALTAVAGSSDYFLGGVVPYSLDAKRALLDVPDAILQTVGAVSEECALAMARGARGKLGADLALATTGIAGPGGAEPGKPVGLVYIALADERETQCHRFVFMGDRAAIIEAATRNALTLAIAALQP